MEKEQECISNTPNKLFKKTNDSMILNLKEIASVRQIKNDL